MAHEIRQADEPNAPDLTWTLEAIRPYYRSVTVSSRWEDQFVQGRPGEPSDRTAGASTGQPDVNGHG